MDWETLNPVIRLKSLLGPIPIHPWPILIPQLLLWSFRRFCIEKLIDDQTESLIDYMWDDHNELIEKYAPDGLKNVAATWLIPENVAKMHSSLEEYNTFFTECMALIDRALHGGNSLLEDRISDFLDMELRQLFAEWLGESKKSLLIYPQKDEDDDVFTDNQFMMLIQSLLAFGRKKDVTPAVASVPASSPPLVPLVPSVAQEAVTFVAPPVPSMEVPVAPADPMEVPATLVPTAAPTAAPITTVAEALRRRHTYRRHGRRANRGVTLRSSRARTKTRKVPLEL